MLTMGKSDFAMKKSPPKYFPILKMFEIKQSLGKISNQLYCQ